jgi:hypothetical protein
VFTSSLSSSIGRATLLLTIAASTAVAQDSTAGVPLESATHLVLVRFGARIGL